MRCLRWTASAMGAVCQKPGQPSSEEHMNPGPWHPSVTAVDVETPALDWLQGMAQQRWSLGLCQE